MIEGQADCDNWDGNYKDKSAFIFDWQVLINEIVCTFIFISVILMIKIKEEHIQITKDGISGALGVALTLLGMIQTGGKLGACYNPAVAVALTANAMFFIDDSVGYLTHYSPYYFAGPLVGGLIAGFFHLVHKNVLLEECEDAERRHEREFSHEVKQGLIQNDHHQDHHHHGHGHGDHHHGHGHGHHDDDEERKSPP